MTDDLSRDLSRTREGGRTPAPALVLSRAIGRCARQPRGPWVAVRIASAADSSMAAATRRA